MICIYHSRDLDGWMSAAIVKLKYPDVELIGWDYGVPIPDLSRHDQIVMCDVSFPLAEMDLIASRVKSIQRDFIWIDHHLSAIKANSFEVDGNFMCGYGGIRDSRFAACELTWKFFFPDETMPEIVRLLGRYDCFGHKGTDEELKVLEFQYGARANFFDPETCLQALKDWDDNLEHSIQVAGYNIYNYLCTEAQQIYARRFTVRLDGKLFACVNQERFNPVNFGIDYHKDGYDGFACFHYQNGQFTYSLYSDNGNVDCSVLCKRRGGGGHKGAAGFRTDKMLQEIEKISQDGMICESA
jgi:oligoribonuclease NrnB/cAMP/cGMP phosphodiesterase (DHH superfamily)